MSKGDKKTDRITLRLAHELKMDIERKANLEDRSVSNVIALILESYFAGIKTKK